ncbi:Uncharacterised protein [Klebsiella pneumoniae]|nr:Uncharacterised protein [Klebsiella pneumoniae]
MMSLWDALRMNMMISYQELVRTFPSVLLKRPEHLDPGRNKSGRFAKKRPLLLPLTVTLHDTREARC